MKYFFLFGIIIVLTSCAAKNKQGKENINTNQVILIFEKPKVNNRYTLETGKKLTSGDFYEVSYIDDALIKHKLPLNYLSTFDTITIITNRSTIEVDLCYKALDQLTFFFKKGDTVQFVYEGVKPIADVKNRKTLPFDINYDIVVRDKIFNNNFPGTVKHDNFINFIVFTNEKLNSNETNSKLTPDPTVRLRDKKEEITIKALIQFEKEYNDEVEFLDSLRLNNLISNDIYMLYKHSLNIKYQSYLNKDDGYSSISLDEHFYPRSDSSLFLDFYRSMFCRKAFVYYEPKVNRIVTANSNMPDFPAMFDSICLSNALTNLEREVLLMNVLDLIIETNAKENILAYLDKFSEISKDSVMVNYFRKKYNLNSKSETLKLKDISGNILDYADILKKLKGKVIYVDFWASWCAPCIESMPYSKQLKEEYKNQDLAFIYISMDDSFAYWKNTVKDHNIEANNYLVVNKHIAQLLKDINLVGIPRYLLYDKTGNMVAMNAPRPESSEIRDILTEYINK